jgi:hypothetical protein
MNLNDTPKQQGQNVTYLRPQGGMENFYGNRATVLPQSFYSERHETGVLPQSFYRECHGTGVLPQSFYWECYETGVLP